MTTSSSKYSETMTSEDQINIDSSSSDEFPETSEESKDNLNSNEPKKVLGIKYVDDDKSEKLYYVLFSGLSYIHCRYLTEKELVSTKRGKAALSKFNLKLSNNILMKSDSIPKLWTFEDLDPQPEYYQVERVLDANEIEEEDVIEYFVKWSALGYDQCTWENQNDIVEQFSEKIHNYENRLDCINPKKISSKWHRPPPSKYKEIKEYPKSKEGWELKNYQIEGVNWLRYCYYHKRNSMLGDEMGLGKTAQIVSAIAQISRDEKINGPFLIIAPLSTLHQWEAEFERWSDLNVTVFHGTKDGIKLIIDTDFKAVDKKGRELDKYVNFDVLITNPDTLIAYFKLLKEIDWHYLVVDEAQRVKNRNSTLYTALEELNWVHCSLLTGTPIQNNVEELFNLMHILDKDTFSNPDEFIKKYDGMKTSEKVDELRSLIKPYLLRRVKSDVETSILAKEETFIDVELTKQQKAFYKALISDSRELLLKKLTKGCVPNLTSLCIELRKCCNHPYLIKGAEDRIIEEKRKELGPDVSERELDMRALIESSGKLILIDKLLPKLLHDKHKVLIFSQWTRILDILEDFLHYREYKYERIDGSIKGTDRQLAIDRFANDPSVFVFLISTKAGGVGINLTQADTVILFDSDWNPQNDLQAEARCHRIGQTKKVKVYRLVTRNTYEAKMIEVATRKLGLDHVILDGRNANMEKLKPEEIEEMLRTGITTIFQDDNKECDEFCAADIDQILERRAKVFTSDVISGGQSIFAKASFNTNDDNAKLGQKDFWQKFIPVIENPPEEEMSKTRNGKSSIYSPAEREEYERFSMEIDQLISSGFNYKKDEAFIVKNAAAAAGYMDKVATKIIHDLVDEIPAREEYPSNVLSLIYNKSNSIVQSVCFFMKVKMIIVNTNVNKVWPLVHPVLFYDAKTEYALLLAVATGGWNNLSGIIDNKKYCLKGVNLPPRQAIEKFANSMFKMVKCEKKTTQALYPGKWEKSIITPEIKRIRLMVHIYDLMLDYGIPLNDDYKPDWDKLMEIGSITDVPDFQEIALNVCKTIEKCSVWLANIVGEMALRKAKKQINAMQLIHKTAIMIKNKRGFFAPDIKINELPSWWQQKHSEALIKNLSEFGMTKVAAWLVTDDSPFKDLIPQSSLSYYQAAAAKELENERPRKPKSSGPLGFLFENNRVFIAEEICNSYTTMDSPSFNVFSSASFPLKVEPTLTIKSIGVLPKDPKYEGNLTPFPVGFQSVRLFKFPNDPRTFEVLNEIHEGPLFSVTLINEYKDEKDAKQLFDQRVLGTGSTPTESWRRAIAALVEYAKVDYIKTRISGSSLFGLSNSFVFSVLSEMKDKK